MKNILLAVTGLSPQVITETLYVLHQNARKVDSIHIITTRDGKDLVYSGLLGGKGGKYFQYLEEYGFDPAQIDFTHRNVHVITDEHGIEVADIANEKDNERLLKRCLELAFEFTSDPENSVIFSIAGGRKTMSSCLTLAAQMYGRPQDRLYHVLVSPEFEGNRDFYYPPKESARIELRDKNGHPIYKDTRFAHVALVPIPFFSIRNYLSPEFLKEPMDPGTLMLSLIREEESRLIVNLINRKIIYKNIELDMMPAHMALYAFFAMQKKDCMKGTADCGRCTDCFMDIQAIYDKQDQITGLYKKVSGVRPLDEMSETGISGLNTENFNSYKAKLRHNLLEKFGPYALKDLEIASEGKRPDTRYGMRMDKAKMEIVL